MFAVRERLAQIRKVWHEHYDAFTIEEEGIQAIEAITAEVGDSPEPKISDYKSKALFFVARAKWQLAHPTALAKQVNTQIASAKSKLNFGVDQL